MSENGETEINLFGTSLLCEKHSVFEGIAHFVKISITIKANGFHNFLRLIIVSSFPLLPLMICVMLTTCSQGRTVQPGELSKTHRPLLTGLSARVLALPHFPCHKAWMA